MPLLRKTIQLCGVTGHHIKVLGQTELGETKLGPISVIVVEDIAHAMILGRDVLKQEGAAIDYVAGMLSWRGYLLPLQPRPTALDIASLGDRPPKMASVRSTAGCDTHLHDEMICYYHHTCAM